MKTMLDSSRREEIISRIQSINENSTRKWGKMNVFQMILHCKLWDEWVHGKNDYRYKQAFLGRIFGKMVLRKMSANDEPIDKNVPTTSDLKIQETTGDLEAEKSKWIALIRGYESYSNPAFVHDFFGKMTDEQIGILAYKHADHHLRQFGC